MSDVMQSIVNHLANQAQQELNSSGSLQQQELRAHLAGFGFPTQRGKFEITAITAGEGNGWLFSEAALQESLPLWDGVACFVDHGGWMDWTRSVRDLCGTCKDPRWDPETNGIVMTLETMGPSGPLVDELGREILEDGRSAAAPLPTVGFSADVVFTAKGSEVQKILRILDLSLVFNPARGGAFKRALNAKCPECEGNTRMGAARCAPTQYGGGNYE